MQKTIQRKEKVLWIEEKEAAAILGLTPNTFRRYVKDSDRAMGINFTHVNNRKFKYNRYDIEQYLFNQSTLYASSK